MLLFNIRIFDYISVKDELQGLTNGDVSIGFAAVNTDELDAGTPCAAEKLCSSCDRLAS